jgi:signal transduction histidine kinase
VIQLFSNVVGNAVKFTPEGGTVILRAEPDQAMVRFAVADNGPGIAAEELPFVFDRYYQARRRNRDGIGLGLSIARGIVEAHGGRIWVESPTGQAPAKAQAEGQAGNQGGGGGTTFFFTLPAPQQ